MKNRIFSSLIALAASLSAPQITQAQGTTYLSNLGLTSSGALAVGSDSWLAMLFSTGANPGGYVLNSVQLAMTTASGSPSGFTAMVYTDVGIVAPLPGINIGSLSGSLSPITADTYTYTAPANLTLLPATLYHIVLTAATVVNNGAYESSVTSIPSPGYNIYGWAGLNSTVRSSNGSSWSFVPGSILQLAINATPVPEASMISFFVLGGVCFLCRSRKKRQGSSPILLTPTLLPVLVCAYSLRADPGALDTSFDPGTTLGTGNLFGDCGVKSIALQPNGMCVAGGTFHVSGDNALRNFLARLDSRGVLDSTFNVFLGSNIFSPVFSVLLQPDRKIVIGGSFMNVNGEPRNRIARLNENSSLDDSFNPGTGADGTVVAVALQPNGKLVVGGAFTSMNDLPRTRLARLNTDGSVDTDFDPKGGANNTVYAVTLQGDGKVVAGGIFTSINGTNRNRIARLNIDGSLDATFNPPSGIDDGSGTLRRVLSVVIQPDGRILVGGWFSSANGQPCTGIVRFEADGTTDTNFNVTCLHNPGLAGDLGFVNAVALQPDGKVLVAGNFIAYYGGTNTGISRLNRDGSLDPNFSPGPAANQTDSLAIQPDGKIMVGGGFTSFGGLARYLLARLDGDPVLHGAVTMNQIVLSWPASYTNFTLQHAPALSPDAQWATNPSPAVILGSAYVVTNSIDSASGFYRLKR